MRSMDVSAYFRDKKITVMGLGLLGGVGDIAYLAECGADIIATDLKSEEELRPSLDKLKRFTNIRYTIGRHDLADFKNRDLIIKAPSTPTDSPYINEARTNGIQVSMWSALFATFAREAGATIIGVTGTRGKSTVTAMIASILRAGEKKVVEGGNVQGTSVLTQLANVSPDTIAVLELDSWKLQGFGEAKISPNIGVFTTFYPDHLNYYGGDMNVYLADKAKIFLNQTENDVLILGAQTEPIIRNKYQPRSKIIVPDALPADWPLSIPGEHNRYNAALALAASRELGVADEVSRKALEAFAGVPGRLEFLREVRDIKIYNDTTSTTPEATLAALSALKSMSGRRTSRHDESGFSQPVILIMGGTDKGLDMDALIARLPEMKRFILLAGNGTDRIKNQLPDTIIYENIADAVKDAFAHAKSGDTILFSPAFTSFGMFKNEFDRGDQFNAVIASYG